MSFIEGIDFFMQNIWVFGLAAVVFWIKKAYVL